MGGESPSVTLCKAKSEPKPPFKRGEQTSAPHWQEISATSWLSIKTIILVMLFKAMAWILEYAISGLPASTITFLQSMPLKPTRAGMRVRIGFSSVMKLALERAGESIGDYFASYSENGDEGPYQPTRVAVRTLSYSDDVLSAEKRSSFPRTIFHNPGHL